MARSKFKSLIFTCTAVLMLTILWGYLFIWRSPEFLLDKNTCQQFDRILTMKEYGKLTSSHPRPLIIKNERVLVFGSEHTKEPKDPQLIIMKTLFSDFNPTVVLVEGRLGFLIPYLMNPVKHFGEMGMAASLAKSDNKKLYSWDSPKNEVLNELKNHFSPEQIALKEILNPYFSNLRFGKPESPDDYVTPYLERASWLGVKDQFRNVNDIDKKWQNDFPDEKDWRDINDQWGLPGYLGEIGDQSNHIRNQHLVCGINSLIEKGEKVFVVCGSSHAACIKPHLVNE